MTDREQLVAMIEQLPDDRLSLALKQIEALISATASAHMHETEPIEFVIYNSPTRKIREPLRIHASESRAQVMMEVGVPTEAHRKAANTLSANLRWWRDHHAELIASYRDTYIAISQGAVFVGVSYFDVLARATANHPTDMPFVIRLFHPSSTISTTNTHAY